MAIFGTIYSNVTYYNGTYHNVHLPYYYSWAYYWDGPHFYNNGTYYYKGPYSYNVTYYHGTSLDKAMNYVYGITLLAVAIIGLCLNFLVFYNKFRNPQTRTKLSSVLFQLLAAANVLILSLRGLWPAYCLLKPELLPVWGSVTLLRRIYHIVFYASILASVPLTTLICVVRYFKIRDPLRASSSTRWYINVVACMCALLIYIALIIVLIKGTLSDGVIGLYSHSLALVIPGDYLKLAMIVNFCIVFFSLLFSSLTIYSLTRSAGRALSDDQRRSTVTILMLNVPDYVYISGIVLYHFVFDIDGQDYCMPYLEFFWLVMIHPIVAFYYPTVICVRSSAIRLLVAGWWRSIVARYA